VYRQFNRIRGAGILAAHYRKAAARKARDDAPFADH
jgi:hypothetical protein